MNLCCIISRFFSSGNCFNLNLDLHHLDLTHALTPALGLSDCHTPVLISHQLSEPPAFWTVRLCVVDSTVIDIVFISSAASAPLYLFAVTRKTNGFI